MSLTLIFVIITVAASLAAWQNHSLMSKWIFNPYQVWHRKEYFRFISSGFIHKDTLHLLLNMFVFYMFGDIVESIFLASFPAGLVIYWAWNNSLSILQQTVIMRRARKADERKKAGSRIGPAKTSPASGGNAGNSDAGGNTGGKKKK